MEIETPSLSDFVRLNQIAKQVHNIHVSWRPDIFKKDNNPLKEEYFKGILERNELLVAKENREIVGYIIYKIFQQNNPIMVDRKILYIEFLGVDKNHQKKGIGQLLMGHVIELGVRKECTDIQLSVSEENLSARCLYEKIGMKQEKVNYSMKIN